jgi:hypothetical protein
LKKKKPSKKTLLDAAGMIESMAEVLHETRLKGKSAFDLTDQATRSAKISFDYMKQIAKELKEAA